MRIGLNLLHALPEIGGAWNYIAGLLVGIGEWDTDNTYVAFVTQESQVLLPAVANFKAVHVDIRSEIRASRILYENTLLHFQARNHKLDLMHWFANTQGFMNAVPAAVTFYDLMVFAKPEAFNKMKRTYLHRMMDQTVRRAQMLLPMSEATASDLRRVLKADPARMTVIPPILNSQFKVVDSAETSNLRARYSLPENYWLYVAHFYPHKNHVRLLEAYHHLKANGASPWPLILCGDLKGADEVILSTIVRYHLEQDVILLSAGPPKDTANPRLAWSELPALFSAASAQVYPSLFEGAGIPVLEAMACGCPLLSSGIPSVREFAGDAAEYFDAEDIYSISTAMWQFQQNPVRRSQCRQLGIARAAEFRARPVVDKLLRAYRQIAHASRIVT